MNKHFIKSIRCQVLTGALVFSMIDVGSPVVVIRRDAPPPKAPAPLVLVNGCECSYVADNGQKACVPAVIAVFVIIVGGVMIWGLKKMCKKLDPPPPPLPPPPPKIPTNSVPGSGTNTNHRSSLKLSQALTDQWIASQIPVDQLFDNTNGPGIAAWDVSSLGYLDPSNSVNYYGCVNFTMQTSSNLSDWDDAFSAVIWTSINAGHTNALTVFYLGRTGYTTNGTWVEGTPVLTNYSTFTAGMTPMECPIDLLGSQRKFFRLMSVQR